jgi:ABC-type branched-subunit amino acid transport system substrate-binding protein
MAKIARRNLYIGISLIVVLAVGLAGGYYVGVLTSTATGTSGKTPVGPPIKIGVVMPLTGPDAYFGKQWKDSLLMTYDDLNASGQIPVYVDGQLRDIQFLFYDDASDAATATTQWEAAYSRDGCDIVGWNVNSGTALAVFKIPNKYGKIGFVSAGETDAIDADRIQNPNASSNWFKSVPEPELYTPLFVTGFDSALASANYALRNKKVALLCEDSSYGRSVASAMSPAFTKDGWNVTSVDYFSLSPAETDFTPLILKYKEADDSLVYTTSTGAPSIIAFIKQSSSMGLNAFRGFFGVGWLPVSDWYPSTGAASDYILSMDTLTPATGGEAWLDRFQARYGYRPAAYVAEYFVVDHLTMLVQAMKIAGTMNTTILRQTLLNMHYIGISGIDLRYVANPEGIPAGTGNFMEEYAGFDYYHYDIVQWIGGNSTKVYPLADAKPIQIPPSSP